MDFYCYYKERFGWGPNPYSAVAQCQQIAMELMDNPHVPFRVAVDSSVGFLSALADFAGDGCTVTMAFDTIMNSVIEAMQRMRDTTEALDKEWCREMMEAEQGPCGAPMYDPDEYAVRPVDIDGEEPDELPKEVPVTILAPDDPDADAVFEAIRAMYGDEGEARTIGTRRPFPDWERIAHWIQSDWIKLQTYKEKVLIAAGHDFLSMDRATNALATAKDAMNRIPLPRQVELAMWATEIVDGLIFGLEDNLGKMCAGSLHSHAGRLVQKQLVSATNGQAQNGPD